MVESGVPNPVADKARQEFLFKMYDQMFADINRHILVVWQSVGVLVGGVALFALVEKEIIPLDYACTAFAIVAGWSVAHSLEAGYWYNRNLAIIGNIERQFLRPSDATDIVWYFKEHRQTNKLLHQLQIQVIFAGLMTFLFLCLHFVTRVLPGVHEPLSSFQFSRSLPYLGVITVIILLVLFQSQRNKSYREFLKQSPGIKVGTPESIVATSGPLAN